MERKFIEKLIYWKDNHIKQPFMLIGARQTGKTYILKIFCKKFFENYLYINFEEKKDYLAFFEESLNPEEMKILMILSFTPYEKNR